MVRPEDMHKIYEMGASEGRTIFDHSWVELFYLNAIKDAKSQLQHLATELSVFGEAHRETQRKAMDLYRWRLLPDKDRWKPAQSTTWSVTPPQFTRRRQTDGYQMARRNQTN